MMDKTRPKYLNLFQIRLPLLGVMSIMNCFDVCPKGLDPTRAIGKIRELMVKRMV